MAFVVFPHGFLTKLLDLEFAMHLKAHFITCEH